MLTGSRGVGQRRAFRRILGPQLPLKRPILDCLRKYDPDFVEGTAKYCVLYYPAAYCLGLQLSDLESGGVRDF
jgi:hypothetical protein